MLFMYVIWNLRLISETFDLFSFRLYFLFTFKTYVSGSYKNYIVYFKKTFSEIRPITCFYNNFIKQPLQSIKVQII